MTKCQNKASYEHVNSINQQQLQFWLTLWIRLRLWFRIRLQFQHRLRIQICSGSINPSIYGKILVQTTTIEDQEKHIQQVQEQLRESNKARLPMIGGGKQRGKNAAQKNEKYALGSHDESNIGRISHIIC